MATTTFTDKNTVIEAEWLNEVDALVWDVFGGASDDATARTNLGVTASWVLSELATVDGAGSGLDADLLDGQQGSYYLPAGSYTAADVLAKLVTVDGAGSGVDADTLDGQHAADFYQQSNILGTVSQSGGVPTGAIIERGSNANGEYVKFADGTMICKHTDALGRNVNVAAGSIYKSDGEYTWTFPATFAALPAVKSSIRTASALWTDARAANTTQGAVRAYCTISTTAPLTIDITAIGRWF